MFIVQYYVSSQPNFKKNFCMLRGIQNWKKKHSELRKKLKSNVWNLNLGLKKQAQFFFSKFVCLHHRRYLFSCYNQKMHKGIFFSYFRIRLEKRGFCSSKKNEKLLYKPRFEKKMQIKFWFYKDNFLTATY